MGIAAGNRAAIDEFVGRVYSGVVKALKSPKLREYFLTAGYQPTAEPPAQFQKNFQADLRHWAELARLAKIVPE